MLAVVFHLDPVFEVAPVEVGDIAPLELARERVELVAEERQERATEELEGPEAELATTSVVLSMAYRRSDIAHQLVAFLPPGEAGLDLEHLTSIVCPAFHPRFRP